MANAKKADSISADERSKIMAEVTGRPGGVSVKDIMTKHGRTEQTYYFWKRQAEGKTTAPRVATKRAKPAPRKAAKSESPAIVQGILMPEGRAVRIHKTDTEWAIVTFE